MKSSIAATSGLEEGITEAAFAYHGKRKPPKQIMDHKCELDVVITRSDQGIVDPSTYTVRNVTGKYIMHVDRDSGALVPCDDTLSYCLDFITPQSRIPVDHVVVNVRVAPNYPQAQRRGGRAECGFTILPDTYEDDDDEDEDEEDDNGGGEKTRPVARGKKLPSAFYSSVSGYSIVFSAEHGYVPGSRRAKQIYFSLVNVNFDPDKSSLPIWRLDVDDSGILALHNSRWKPLEPTHPDSAVDPGVPIERRPQRSPGWYWFRSTCEYYELFKGKISGTRLFTFLGGGYGPLDFINNALTDFKGNHLTRCGRENESALPLAYLEANPQVTMYECGTFPHENIEDLCAAPDAIIEDKTRTFDELPSWYKETCVKRGLQYKVDWSKGVFEAKVMKDLDKLKEGPTIRPDHICQQYGEMICSKTYWGQLARLCLETKEIRVYRIYRNIALAERIEACVRRMRKEMIAGTPYHVAADHDSNREIIKAFKTQASYYNHAADRYSVIPFPEGKVKAMHDDVWSRDIIASMPDNPALPLVRDIGKKGANVTGDHSVGMKPKRGGGRKKATSEAVAPVIPKEIPAAAQPKKTRQTTIKMDAKPKAAREPPSTIDELWGDFEATTKVMSKCFKNKDYDIAFDDGVIRDQIVRLMDLEVMIAVSVAATATATAATLPPMANKKAKITDSQSMMMMMEEEPK